MSFFNNYKLGVGLALIIILMFLIVSIFFCNQHYFKTSLLINGFVLPALFTFSVLWALLQLKKQNNGQLSFKKAFTFSYINQLIGGFLSLGFILVYMNFISPETKDIFNYQYLNENYQKFKEEALNSDTLQFEGLSQEESQVRAAKILDYLKQTRDELSKDFFSFSESQIWGVIFGMNMFYLLNSLFLSLFLKTNTKRSLSE